MSVYIHQARSITAGKPRAVLLLLTNGILSLTFIGVTLCPQKSCKVNGDGVWVSSFFNTTEQHIDLNTAGLKILRCLSFFTWVFLWPWLLSMSQLWLWKGYCNIPADLCCRLNFEFYRFIKLLEFNCLHLFLSVTTVWVKDEASIYFSDFPWPFFKSMHCFIPGRPSLKWLTG